VSDQAQSKQKRHTYQDRITLSAESFAKLSLWLEQVVATNKGINVDRSDLVNWLVQTHEADLALTQLKQLESQFYDPVKYAKWVLSHVKEAKARGENLTIKIVGEHSHGANEISVRPKRMRKKAAKTDDDTILAPTSSTDKEAN
jgi:hypothetical protein